MSSVSSPSYISDNINLVDSIHPYSVVQRGKMRFLGWFLMVCSVFVYAAGGNIKRMACSEEGSENEEDAEESAVEEEGQEDTDEMSQEEGDDSHTDELQSDSNEQENGTDENGSNENDKGVNDTFDVTGSQDDDGSGDRDELVKFRDVKTFIRAPRKTNPRDYPDEYYGDYKYGDEHPPWD